MACLPQNGFAIDLWDNNESANSAVTETSSQDSKNIEQKLDRLERSLSTLEKYVYRQSGGESSGSATKPFEQEVEYTGNNIELRLSDIESKLRDLTGQIEELKWRTKNPVDSTPISSTDFSSKPESTFSGETNEEVVTIDQELDGSDIKAEDGTRILGTIPANNIDGEVSSAAANTRNLTDIGPKYEYDKAFGLLRQAKYSDAAEAFHKFIEKHPDNVLVGNAYYWLGEAFYVQQDYEQSSVAFLQGYQKDSKGSKAPDNLLKLAISLEALEKKREACATFEKLFKEFPSASKAIRNKADKEIERIGC